MIAACALRAGRVTGVVLSVCLACSGCTSASTTPLPGASGTARASEAPAGTAATPSAEPTVGSSVAATPVDSAPDARTPAPLTSLLPTKSPPPTGYTRVAPPSNSFGPVVGAHGLFVGFIQPFCGVETCYTHDGIYSSDGVDWQVASAPPGTFDNAYVSDVTPYGDGFAASGEIIGNDGSVTGAVWLSADGSDWRLIEAAKVDAGRQFPVCEGAGLLFGGLHAIAAVEKRLVAIGYRMVGERQCRPEQQAIFWLSTDSANWEEVAAPQFWGGGPRFVRGGSMFLASDVSSDPDPALWHSNDGVDWTRTALEEPSNAYLTELVVHGDGWVALGGYSAHQQTETGQLAWSSTDGQSWELILRRELPVGWDPPHLAVDIEDQIVAGGVFGRESVVDSDGSGYDIPTSGVIESSDGVSWSEPITAPFIESQLLHLATNGTSIVLVGWGFRGNDPRAWVKMLD